MDDILEIIISNPFNTLLISVNCFLCELLFIPGKAIIEWIVPIIGTINTSGSISFLMLPSLIPSFMDFKRNLFDCLIIDFKLSTDEEIMFIDKATKAIDEYNNEFIGGYKPEEFKEQRSGRSQTHPGLGVPARGSIQAGARAVA